MAFGSSSTSYDQSALNSADWNDLGLDALQSFIRKRAPKLLSEYTLEESAIRLGIASRTGARCVPTVAGMLVFGENPQWTQPQWGVSALKIEGIELTDSIITRADIEGCLADLVAQSMDFVRQHSREMINPTAPNDLTFEFAERGVREALLNALIHRDLRATGRVAIRIFSDRLEIWSPGGAIDSQANIEDWMARGGVSLPRNPLLAALARLSGMGEQVGRGLALIRRLTAEKNRQNARIEVSRHDVLVCLPSGFNVTTDVPDTMRN